MTASNIHSRVLNVTSLTYAAEAASSKTLEALAQGIRALSPEVSGVSFHDFAADTLWMSEDFILPEDYQLVEDSLSSDSGGNLDVSYAPREDGNYSLAIPVRDAQGSVNGAVPPSLAPSLAGAPCVVRSRSSHAQKVSVEKQSIVQTLSRGRAARRRISCSGFRHAGPAHDRRDARA